MSAARDLIGHAALAALGLTLAIFATREETRAPAGEVVVVDCGAIDEVRYSSPGRDVTVRRERSGIRVEVRRRAEDGSEERLRFLGGADAETYLGELSPLAARRDLGALEGEALVDVGLDAASIERTPTHVSMRCGRTTHRFVVGGRAFGTGDRYVRTENGRVVLLAATTIRDLETAELRLVERRLHRFERAEAERAVVRFGGVERVLVQRNRRGADAAWVDETAPETRRTDYDRLMRAVLGLAIARYLDEPVELPEPAIEVRFADVRGRALGELSLHPIGEGADARWLARSDASGGVVEVLPSTGAAVLRAAERLDAVE